MCYFKTVVYSCSSYGCPSSYVGALISDSLTGDWGHGYGCSPNANNTIPTELLDYACWNCRMRGPVYRY